MGSMSIMHWGFVPEQSPVHPSKVKPVAGVAVSVTAVPLSNRPVHTLPQLIPPTLDVTVPEAGVARVTLMAGLHPRNVHMASHSGCDISWTLTIAMLGLPQVVPNRGNPE